MAKNKRPNKTAWTRSAAKWVGLWIVGYFLGLISPKEVVLQEIYSTPKVTFQSVWREPTIKQIPCSTFTLEVDIAPDEEIKDFSLNARFPVHPIDIQITSFGESYPGLSVTGVSAMGGNCQFQQFDQLTSPLGVTSSTHGSLMNLFDLHADKLTHSIPLYVVFSFPPGTPHPAIEEIHAEGSYERLHTLLKYSAYPKWPSWQRF